MRQKSKTSLSIGSEVLQSLFENGKSPLSDQFMRWKLWAQWEEFVGPTIAQNVEPVGYQKGVLYLWVRSSSWMQQMVFMRDAIQQKINKKLGRRFVSGIRYTLDRRDVPNQDDTEFKNHIQRIAPSEQDEN